MAVTKDEEFKALEKMRKIVEGLGEDSYIGTAFEGCFEVAEDNIRNDFLCSMRQRWLSAEKETEKFSQELKERDNQIEQLKKEINGLESDREALTKRCESLSDNNTKLWNQYRECQEKVEPAEMEIMQLKAKLYDLICK
ncbi:MULTISPECIES: hypothetical protein [unclassified Blautia]|uniref:hypothetical protein n=1 Tax=unclassified Blautia TaxID=2648079 RepID=UPI001FD4BFDE|nr:MULTISPECIES: hypothetical protein [unclassified Blautia]MCJ7861215.1 hypothetical protein [Blautia sp. NSJ-157]MCJ7863981.1 hypothetical protein [Blautia sp. NSJ-140]